MQSSTIDKEETMMAKQKNTKVHLAVAKAISIRGLKYSDVAKLLGIKEQTVRSSISYGWFDNTKAARWSAALDIPISVFLEGTGDNYISQFQQFELLSAEIKSIKKDIGSLRHDVQELQTWQNRVMVKE